MNIIKVELLESLITLEDLPLAQAPCTCYVKFVPDRAGLSLDVVEKVLRQAFLHASSESMRNSVDGTYTNQRVLNITAIQGDDEDWHQSPCYNLGTNDTIEYVDAKDF